MSVITVSELWSAMQNPSQPSHNASAILPLSMVNHGEEVEMTGIRGGQGVQKRLSDLGLLPGTAMRVVQGGVDGPMIVAVRGDTRIALGRGVAQKVMVRMRGGM